jgi:hypothetical protein
MGLRPTQADENALCSATTLYATVALSFVIPAEAKRSGGICSSADLWWKCFSTDRSEVEGPAVLLLSTQFPVVSPLSPLSSRAKPRDLQFHSICKQCWDRGAIPNAGTALVPFVAQANLSQVPGGMTIRFEVGV